MTGVVINDSEDSGKTFYGPSYNFTSNTIPGDWNYQNGVMTIEQPSKFETYELLPGNPASPSDNDIIMMHQTIQSYLPNDILFDPTVGNKMWYLISLVEYTSAQLATILADATLIPNLQLIAGNPSKWEGTFLFDISLTQSNYVYLILDYRKTITTTTTTAIPTTTTTTTACVNRPTGLTNGNLISAVNNPGDPSRNFSNVSVAYACETFNYFRAVPVTSGSGTSFIGMQYSTLAIGEVIYSGNNGTNCTRVPDGFYWFQPDITNQVTYFKNINQISIVTTVSGVITAIDVCDYVPPTTTTTTTAPAEFNFVVRTKSQDILSPAANITIQYSLDGGNSFTQYGVPLNPSTGYPNYNLTFGLKLPSGTNVRVGIMDSSNGNVRFGTGQNSGNFITNCGLANTFEVTTSNSDTDVYLNVAVSGGALVSC
jgi:hypothetical protein